MGNMEWRMRMGGEEGMRKEEGEEGAEKNTYSNGDKDARSKIRIRIRIRIRQVFLSAQQGISATCHHNTYKLSV